MKAFVFCVLLVASTGTLGSNNHFNMKASLVDLVGLKVQLPDDENLMTWHHALESSEFLFSVAALTNKELKDIFRSMTQYLAGVEEYWLYTGAVDHDSACYLIESYPIEDAYTYRMSFAC